MSKLRKLILEENRHRRLAHTHENKAEHHWNKANDLLLEIQQEAEKEKELDCSEQANSQ